MFNPYKLALAATVAAALILIWLSLGVGIIGGDGDPANRMYFGVIAIGIAGALIVRFRPAGMARTLVAMAVAQALIALYAVLGGLGRPYSGPLELAALNGFFIVMFLGSAWLFRRAEQSQPERAATPV